MDVMVPANIRIRRGFHVQNLSDLMQMRICCAIKIISYFSYCDTTLLLNKIKQFQMNW